MYSTVRRIVVVMVGGVLLLVGVVLIFTPGPAFLVLGLAFAVLGAEFVWARRLLKQVRAMAESAVSSGDASSTNDHDGSGRVTKDLRGGGAEE